MIIISRGAKALMGCFYSNSVSDIPASKAPYSLTFPTFSDTTATQT
jgi:hypothetical protein